MIMAKMTKKYYKSILEQTTISHCIGANIVIPAGFADLSCSIIQSCTVLQHLLQKTIYATHGAQLLSAKRTLKEFPNPKARIDFLCSFPYSEDDPTVLSAFNYARLLFRDIYELRNILAHELWASSEDYSDTIIFSSLDEQARLQMASGQIWHVETTTPQEVYDATIRFIRSLKLITTSDLRKALADADLCSWILMQIEGILDEQDPKRKEDARRPIRQYRGTSHLFEDTHGTDGILNFSATRRKYIHR
jgi:hypothetical protein